LQFIVPHTVPFSETPGPCEHLWWNRNRKRNRNRTMPKWSTVCDWHSLAPASLYFCFFAQSLTYAMHFHLSLQTTGVIIARARVRLDLVQRSTG